MFRSSYHVKWTVLAVIAGLMVSAVWLNVLPAARVQAAPQVTITVDRTDDPAVASAGSGAAACTNASNDCSLRGAVLVANAIPGSTINVPAGTYTLSITGSDNADLLGDLDINASVTINGAGSGTTIITTIYNSSCGDCKVFGINQDGLYDHLTVSFSGLTIQNGYNSFSASCGNTFQETGGGIDVFFSNDGGGGSFTMSDVIVQNNKTTNLSSLCSSRYGGGINIDAGFQSNPGVTHNTDSVSLTNVQILSNSADTTGGGINFFGDQNTLLMNHVVISGNTTLAPSGYGANGGGINIRVTYGGSATMHNVTIANNTGHGNGGGIDIAASNKANVTIDDTGGTSTISGNIAQSNATISGNGGGLAHDDGQTTVSLVNVLISNNHADHQGSGGSTNQGGGIFVTGNGGTLTMTGGSLSNNTANDAANNKGNGGGLASTHTAGTVTLAGVSISNNTARLNGGGVYVNGAGGTTTINGVTTFSGNTATNGTAGNGFAVAAGTLTGVNAVTIADNVTVAGGTFTSTPGTLTLGGDFTFSSGTFTHNSGTVNFNGSAAQSINGPATPTFNHVTDSNTSAALSVNTSTAVNGNLTINANALLTPAAATIISGAGTLTGSGTAQVTRVTSVADFLTQYTIANKTLTNLLIDYSGAGAQTVNNSPTYSNLKISGSGTKTLQGNATVTGNVDLSAATLAGSSFTLNVGGNWSNSATFTGGSGTVVFNGNNNTQTLSGSTTFNNLTLNHTGTGGVTAAGSTLGVSGLIRVMSGAFTSASTFGDVQIDSGATLSGTNATTMNVGGNWTNNGTFAPNGNTVNFNGNNNTQTLSGSTTFNNLSVNHTGTGGVTASGSTLGVSGLLHVLAGAFTGDGTFVDVQVDSGAALAGSNATTMNVSGDWTNGGTFTPNSNTVVFDGNNNTQTLSGGTTFNNLTINHSGTGGVTAAGSTLGVSGLLRVMAGAFTSASTFANVQIDSGATLAGTNATTMNVSGNWTNDGTFTPNGNTVNFNGTGAQTIGGTTSTAFDNLSVNNSGGSVTLGNDQTVNDLLTLGSDLGTTLNYTLTQIGTSTGSGDVWGRTYRNQVFNTGTTYAFGSPHVALTFGPTSTVPSALLIELEPGKPASYSTATVSRAYTITATSGGPYSATLRLHYQDAEASNGESNLTLVRYNGVTWVPQGSTSSDTTANWVEKSGVTALSPWAISNLGPSAISLRDLQALPTATSPWAYVVLTLLAMGALSVGVFLRMRRRA